MYKAYMGSNGLWYVAWENNEGFHYQGNGIYSEKRAKSIAESKNNQ